MPIQPMNGDLRLPGRPSFPAQKLESILRQPPPMPECPSQFTRYISTVLSLRQLLTKCGRKCTLCFSKVGN